MRAGSPSSVLVTGFSPFPGVVDNASAIFAHLLGELASARRPDWRVTTATLPTEWEAGPRRLQVLIAQSRPTVCLHFGVSTSARGLVVETHARNVAAAKPDAAGCLPERPQLVEAAPSVLLPACQPLPLLAGLAGCELPITAATDAGDYVCNALFFHALWRARRQPVGAGPRRLVAFVHLPLRVGELGSDPADPPATEPLDLDLALAAGLMLLTAMGEQASAQY